MQANVMKTREESTLSKEAKDGAAKHLFIAGLAKKV